MEIVQTGTGTWPWCMSMFGARFAVFVRRARVLPSPCPATRNLSFLRCFTGTVTLLFQLVVQWDGTGWFEFYIQNIYCLHTCTISYLTTNYSYVRTTVRPPTGGKCLPPPPLFVVVVVLVVVVRIPIVAKFELAPFPCTVFTIKYKLTPNRAAPTSDAKMTMANAVPVKIPSLSLSRPPSPGAAPGKAAATIASLLVV